MPAPFVPGGRQGWQQSNEAGDQCVPPCAQLGCFPSGGRALGGTGLLLVQTGDAESHMAVVDA